MHDLRLEPLTELTDEHGGQLVSFLHSPTQRVLYVRWFGNLTGREVTYVAQEALKLQATFHYPLLLNDKSQATGDWNEAMEFLEYEWLPQALKLGMRAVAYVFSPDLNNQLVSLEFFERVRKYTPIQMFYDVPTAWQWLRSNRRRLVQQLPPGTN